MRSTELLPSIDVIDQAERELSAYLRAAADLVETGTPFHAADLWIRVMEAAGCPGPNTSEFFRKVTIRAIAELTREGRDFLRPPYTATPSPATIAAL